MDLDLDSDSATTEEQPTDSLEELRARRALRTADREIEDEANAQEDLELPGADLSGEELVIHVLPKQHDEFTCSSCFLVHHRSQRVRTDPDLCSDCA